MNKVRISNQEYPVLLAITRQEQQLGLMYKEPPLPCMAFIYNTPSHNSFWMKGVKAPLDLVFCNRGEIVSIARGESYSTRVIDPAVESDLVIEMPAKTCEANQIKVGDSVELDLDDASRFKILAHRASLY